MTLDFGMPANGNAAAAIRAATMAGQLPRVRHCRKCAKCGGLLIEGFRERTGRDAYLHDYSRLVWYCERCGEVADR